MPAFRVKLSTLFTAIFCIAVGLTVGTVVPDNEAGVLRQLEHRLHWHNALLATGSTVLAMGLFSQAIFLNRACHQSPTETPDNRFSWQIAISRRLLTATTLVICIVTHILVSKWSMKIPEPGDLFFFGRIFPDFIWRLAIIIGLAAYVCRTRVTELPSRERSWLFLVLGILLGLYALREYTLVPFLVHLAIAGVEGAQPLRWQRTGTFLTTVAEQSRFFWLSAFATVS